MPGRDSLRQQESQVLSRSYSGPTQDTTICCEAAKSWAAGNDMLGTHGLGHEGLQR